MQHGDRWCFSDFDTDTPIKRSGEVTDPGNLYLREFPNQDGIKGAALYVGQVTPLEGTDIQVHLPLVFWESWPSKPLAPLNLVDPGGLDMGIVLILQKEVVQRYREKLKKAKGEEA